MMAPTTETMSSSANPVASGHSGLAIGKSISTGLTTNSLDTLRENETKLRREFFKKEPCFYSHQVYKKAAVIFNSLKQDKHEDNPYLKRKQEEEKKLKPTEVPHIDFENTKEKKLAFELAFSTLKFQHLLGEMLEDVSFFSQFPEHREDESVVVVMLQDYHTRKFQFRHPLKDEIADADIQAIEEALLSCSIKLNASLARNRIRHQVVSIEHLLPLAVRETELSSQVPVYLWVNKHKTSLEDVITRLTLDGFIQVHHTDAMSNQMFCCDPHCDDVLTFSPDVREDIITHDLITQGHLILQDKSSCYGPHSVRYLINDGDDVIHVNIGAGTTTAHLSSLLGKKTNHIWAFGNFPSEEELQQTKKMFEKLQVKNVKLIGDRFLDISPDDVRLKNTKVVLISAECSKSGVGNPVDFVITEGEDMTILKDLSIGEKDENKLSKLIAQQGTLLKHAMRMTKVQAIIYCTRSIHQGENETAINKAIEYANTALLRKVPYRVAPPVLPFSGDDIDSGNILDRRFIKVKPSSSSNGCFVALVTREPEEIQETAKDILERAAAKGLLGPKSSKPRKVKLSTNEEGDSQGQREETPTCVDKDVKEKLLHRRVRKPQQKIPSSRITPPTHVTAKVQTHNIAYKGSHGTFGRQSQTRHISSTRTSESVVSRLYKSHFKALSSPPLKHKSYILEYRKVVKHPAPFR